MWKICLGMALAGLFTFVPSHAATLSENFAHNPLDQGWQVFGETNLFQWDATNLAMDVTWDSTQPNSYFYHSLGRTVTTNDGFCLVFDLQVNDAVAFNGGAQLAIGLLNFAEATNPIYSRTLGSLPNVFELDYFPAFNSGGNSYPASLDATLIDSQINYYFAYDNLPLNQGISYHVLLLHLPNTIGIRGEIFTNGQLMTALPMLYNSEPASDAGAFQLNALAIMNYTDDGYGDDILAHGSVRNLAFATPLPVGIIKAPAPGQVHFASDTNWLYTLEQSVDFQNWSPVAPAVPGNGTNLVLQATNLPPTGSFYRVQAGLR